MSGTQTHCWSNQKGSSGHRISCKPRAGCVAAPLRSQGAFGRHALSRRVCTCMHVFVRVCVHVCPSYCLLTHITSSLLHSMCPTLAPLCSPRVWVARSFFLTPLEGPGLVPTS